VTARERRVFLAYGVTAAMGSFSILGFAVVKLGSFLIDKEQPMAFVFFAGLLGTKFRRRFEHVEKLSRERNIDLAASDLEVLDQLWDEVKGSPAGGVSNGDERPHAGADAVTGTDPDD